MTLPESGRTVAFNVKNNPHLDYGYGMTSHSSQGQTADRALVHVDTEQAGEKLVNRRWTYVVASRGRYDAQIYTNNKGQSYRATRTRRVAPIRDGTEPRIPIVSTRDRAVFRVRASADRACFYPISQPRDVCAHSRPLDVSLLIHPECRS